jgi:hypothetical protein
MKTTVSIPFSVYVRNNLYWNFRTKLKMLLGVASSPKRAIENSERLKQNGPLTAAQLKEQSDAQVKKVGKSAVARAKQAITESSLSAPQVELPMQNKGAILLERALRQNPDVKHVANIGARVDLVSAFLAPKFPQVQFTSVDLQLNVAEHNAALPQSPNWDFLGGYALHLMDEGRLKADLVFMTSTSVLFNNMELEAYLAAFAKQVKVVVLNEPWWPNLRSTGLTILRPEDVPVDNPVCSGAHGNYHHNYLAKLEKYGYEIVSSEILPAAEMGSFCLQVVARRKQP